MPAESEIVWWAEKENMIENLYCHCGQPINVEINVYDRTCRTDGMRFFVPEETNDRLCLFRCPSCSEVVEYSKLQSLGELPIESPAKNAESAGTVKQQP